MKKNYPSILSLAAMLFVAAMPASASPFEIEENFDDDSHFTQGTTLPDGWSTSENVRTNRINASDSGYPANTDPKVLVVYSPMGGETIYTPKMEIAGGTTCTIEFSTLLPGHSNYPDVRNLGINVYAGNVAEKSQMELIGNLPCGYNREWKHLSYSFRPDNDDEYCFAIELYCENDMYGGNAYFDTFIFTGLTPGGGLVTELEPDPENLSLCQELPFSENFSDPSHYDGSGYLPIGWSSTGTTVWRTAAFDNIPAVDGEYYMVAPESRSERDERAYTPFFNLKAGIEYTISYYTHFDGYLINGEPHTSTLNLTVGTQQDADFHPLTIHSSSRPLDENPMWVLETATFTPSVSGPYCFSFSVEGAPISGFVCVDKVSITSPVDLPRPEPEMAPFALKSFFTDHFITTSIEPIRIFNNSRYALSYDWEAEGATVNSLPDGNVDVFFPASGDYKVSLTATNDHGERSTSRTLSIDLLDGGLQNHSLICYDYGTSKEYARHSIPSWPTDPHGLDYISGFNHYYYTLAQRFDLPKNGFTDIRRVLIYLTNLRYEPIGGGDKQQFELPFNISVYGSDEQGNIDESNLLGRMETTMGDFFHTTSLDNGEYRYMDFQTPVHCQGTVYIVFDLPTELHVDVADPNIGRSFMSIGMMQGRHRQSTFYTKPYAVPEGSYMTPGQWYTIDKFDEQYAGIALNMQLWVDYEGLSGITESVISGDSSVGVSLRGDTLTVAGTAAGEYVAVYTTDGRRVAIARAEGDITTLDCSSLAPGLYVVSTDRGCSKFIR